MDADYELARELLGDLLHWRRDVTIGRRSRVLAHVLADDVRPSPSDIDRIGREIYYGGHADAILCDALAALDRALSRTPGQSDAEEILALRQRCVSARDDLAAIAARNRQVAATRPSIALPAATGDLRHDVMRDAVACVVRQWRSGFGELAHLCRFATTVSREIATGDVFQRALVADALCDLPPPWRDALAPVLSSELAYLIDARRCPVRGWSYYPRLDMIPPDADSLGEILQVTLRLGRRDLSSLFEEPIHQALHVGALGDGTFATWIVPPPGERTELHERQAALVSRTADVEVVANLAYALILFDRSRFEREVIAAARWVASRQRAAGTYPATWYLGTAYTSYVAARLLAACGGFGAELAVARQHLLSTRRPDGGWGRDGEPSNALDTALSLLALEAIGKDAVETVRARALEYLAGFSPDAWPAIPFICQERDDPRPLASKTITAAYVANALARCWS